MIQNLPVIKNLSPVHRATAITVGLLILYELGTNASLGFLLPAGTSPLAIQHFDKFFQAKLFGLGFVAAFTGFFIVEILSFFLPPFKQYRAGGLNGRRQLTKWSLMASLLLAVLYASTFIRSFSGFRITDGQSLLGPASPFHQGLLALVLVLGFVILCGLAALITRHGIGNGFTVIIGYGILRYIPTSIYDLFTNDGDENLSLGRKNILTGEPPNLVGIIFLIFVLIVLYQKFWHRIPDNYKRMRSFTLEAQAEGKPLNFQLPYLPQGVFLLLWPYSIIVFSVQWMDIWGKWEMAIFYNNNWSYWSIYTILLAVISYLSYVLISHPQRIAHNTMGKITFQEGWQKKVQQNAIRSITVITLVWFLWNAPIGVIGKESVLYGSLCLVSIITLAAILKDVISQYRFMQNAEHPRVLETFDNVHFVTYLKGLFEAEGIRFCVQAFEYRRLFYFFEPLIKMRIMVDARDWDRANQLADLDNVTLI